MKPRDTATLFLLAAIWGASFLFIRIAVPALGPTTLVVARVLIAALVLLAYAALIRQKIALRERWRGFLLLGAINAAIPFTLIATAELELPASFASILNATTPLFSALIGAVWLKDALSPKKLAGLVLGMVGVGVVVGWSPLTLSPVVLLSIGLSLLAAFFYGVSGFYTKVAFKGIAPLTMTIGQQLGAGVLLLPFAIANPPRGSLDPNVIISILALAFLSTAFGYLLYFRLIERIGPTSTLSVTFLNPVFGILWGKLFLSEEIAPGQLVGLGLILISLTLITGMSVRLRQFRAAPAPSITPQSSSK
jgi:drug/metabolite transporter (DMT)-like permease